MTIYNVTDKYIKYCHNIIFIDDKLSIVTEITYYPNNCLYDVYITTIIILI